MEQNFLNTNGNLAEKLMAAMQGANFPGADNRCLDDGTSSTTGFLVLYKKDDAIDNPSIKINIGAQPSGVEPIDIIQKNLMKSIKFILILFCSTLLFSKKIYEVDYKSQADVMVHLVDYKSQPIYLYIM